MILRALWTTDAFLLTFAAASVGFAADAAPIQSGVATLSPQNSKIQFVCAHVGPRPDPRKGGFDKFSGKAQLEGKSLKSLTVDIDTASIGTEFEKLTNHLKSPDFFEVRKYPSARFESTKIEPSSGTAPAAATIAQITGKLTLHGVTKEISFPATIEVTETGLKLKSEFTFDRTEWGINYDPTKVEKKVSLTVIVGERT